MSDDGRHSLVVIAFIGTVFSPAYFRARRRGAQCEPREHCALNVVSYGPGGKRWAFTEYSQRSLDAERTRLRIGRNTLHWDESALVCQLEERGAPFPHAVRGTVRLHVPAGRPDFSLPLSGDGAHQWRPIVPRGRIEVHLDRPQVSWQGSGYFDCNMGSAPLDEHFESWNWSRAHLADGVAVLYDVNSAGSAGPSRDHALFFHDTGEVGAFDAPVAVSLPSTGWRLSRATRADSNPASVRVLSTLEDTPFYARSLLSTELRGERTVAVHESLSLARFRAPWVRALLPFRMRRS